MLGCTRVQPGASSLNSVLVIFSRSKKSEPGEARKAQVVLTFRFERASCLA